MPPRSGPRTHYNYFRDYDPSIGRYIQSDPIGLHGGLNTYGYVWGRPLMLTDAFGLKAGGISIPHPGPGIGGAIGEALGAAGRICSKLPLLFMLTASSSGDACSDDPSRKRQECAKGKDEEGYRKCVEGCAMKANFENERCRRDHKNDPAGYNQCAAGVIARMEICVINCAIDHGM